MHKGGSKNVLDNPISLLCVISKVLERCIYNYLRDHLSTLFDDSQHGFLKGRSTVTQLLSFYHEVGQDLDKGLQTDIVYLDFAKAFDSVCNRRLLFKLTNCGIGDDLLKWFRSYLSNRRQRCVVQGYTSITVPVTSGVPQGNILGPLLFLVYVNDLPNVVDNSVILFADHSKRCKVIGDIGDCQELQDLDSLQEWSHDWRLRLNKSKCEVLTVSRKRCPVFYNYQLGNHSLIHVELQKDLGVTVTKDLK